MIGAVPSRPSLGDIAAAAADLSVSDDTLFGLFNGAIRNQQFTAMRFHPAAMEVERIHSTTPESYPVGGRKAKRNSPWAQHVLLGQLPFRGHGEEAIRWAFDDADRILGMGLTTVLNLPVTLGVRTLGTLNFLRGGPIFSDGELARGQVLAALLAERRVRQGAHRG